MLRIRDCYETKTFALKSNANEEVLYLKRGLKLKGTRRPHENKIFELCVKNQFIWENKENNSIFPFKSSFFLMFAGRIGASRGPHVARGPRV